MSEIEQYLVPRTLDNAVQAMTNSDVTVFCGGTDLTLQAGTGQRQYGSALMNIRHIDGLSDITLAEDKIRIGALATVTDVMRDPLLNECTPVLIDTADHFASDQIRNAASIGGNICNASPAGDMIIPLMVLGAMLELARWENDQLQYRYVALDEFFTGPGKTIKQDNELLTAVVFDKPSKDFIARFRKSGPRPALEISIVTLAIGAQRNNNTLSNVRCALGSVGPTPIRASAMEQALEGKPLNDETIASAVDAAIEDASPIDDVRASTWYRNHLVKVFTEEVLNDVCEN